MTGKTNAVTEMNLENPQVSPTTRSGPALPEIKRRSIDDKVILPIKPNFSSSSRNQDTGGSSFRIPRPLNGPSIRAIYRKRPPELHRHYGTLAPVSTQRPRSRR